MSKSASIIKFNDVSFHYELDKPVLSEANCTIRRGAKLTLMGQNGAGKSTLFKLLLGELAVESGDIMRQHGLSIAISRQVIPHDQRATPLRDFFQNCFADTIYDIDRRIADVLGVVQLTVSDEDYEKSVGDFSGGQQARILLASALIQEPDLLLLDEPTNNLDHAGIEHLTEYLANYKKTVLVISHDADFLNAFSDGVLYLDVFTGRIDQYVGNYYDVLEQVGLKIDRDKRQNARLQKQIQEKKDKANFFANKGGRLRAVAKQMREDAADAEANKVAVRRDDKTIRDFSIPVQSGLGGTVVHLTSFTRLKKGKVKKGTANIELRRGEILRLVGPNGIGKTTLLETIAGGSAEGCEIKKDAEIGYYRQDFSNLDMKATPYETLRAAMGRSDEQRLRSVASGFLIDKAIINTPVGLLSEGQKGLVAMARLVMLEPGLIIFDEPTNHINFRHLPVIAKAIDAFEGVVILVSHMEEFVEQIGVTQTLDLDK